MRVKNKITHKYKQQIYSGKIVGTDPFFSVVRFPCLLISVESKCNAHTGYEIGKSLKV